MRILFGKDVCRDFEAASEKEWLETNGLGGYAASTIVGANTRRYHGLLTAATGLPIARHLLLSRLEEALTVGGERHELSCNRYGGAVHPRGHLYQEAFRLDPFPTFFYRIGTTEVEKRVFMVHGENTTVITYAMLGPGEATLEVRPLVAFRDYHGITRENPWIGREVSSVASGVIALRPYPGLPALYLGHDAEEVSGEGWWYRDFWYPRETERGLDDREDLFSPCALRFRLRAGTPCTVIASTEVRMPGAWKALHDGELRRRRSLTAGVRDDFAEALTGAADAFLIRRGDGLRSVIAGYPWFGEWGRDAMIALPGLTLVTGRFEEARSILEAFARHCDEGMIPNRFPDGGERPDYNTVDATLWMFHAVDRYLAYTGDGAFVRETLWPTLVEVVKWHVRGTRYGIGGAEDGLLRAGEPGVQLTWMDAKVGDWVVTPRHGKAVEVNALWHNALRVMEGLAGRFGEAALAREYGRRAALAMAGFEAAFWNEERGCLYDVVDGDRQDGAVRPNQILAVSLPHPALTGEKAWKVVEVVRRELLTPVGLRSLSPADPQYRGRYEGGVWARDGAYHQGTVWAWLIGPFLTAYVRVRGGSRESREEAGGFLAGLYAHLTDAGLGSLSEVFDGDAPHLPRGCIAQAWSVAEALRAYVEEVLGERPEKDTGQEG